MTARKIERLLIQYCVPVWPNGPPGMNGWGQYTPVAEGQTLDDFAGGFQVEWRHHGDLVTRVSGLVQAIESGLGQEQLEIAGGIVDIPLRASELDVDVGKARLTVGLVVGGSVHIPFRDLTPAQRRLLHSINGTIDRIAWEDFRQRLGVAAPLPKRLEVFISYRAGHEKFAEALANRLGREGIVPWFDKWEILAGDSIPGKIEEGLRDSLAFIPIITADYQEGRWATDELHNAIAKRIEQDYRIIPVLLEECERPELIRHLRYVDFSSQDPETFESKFAELIDGIYGLELNPFR